jgi:DNA-binding transcriptional ArsR family regulator
MSSTLNLLRLLADPTRTRLLYLLEPGELSVAEIQEVLGMGQSRISTHLAQLKRAGLVHDRRVGKNIFYSWKEETPIPQPELKQLVELERAKCQRPRQTAPNANTFSQNAATVLENTSTA